MHLQVTQVRELEPESALCLIDTDLTVEATAGRAFLKGAFWGLFKGTFRVLGFLGLWGFRV